MESVLPLQKLTLLKEYAREYHNIEYRFFEHGFFSYHIDKNECTIVDMFITPLKRRKGLAYSYANDFSDELRSLNIEFVYGIVQRDYENRDISILCFKYWGMNYFTETDTELIYYKEL